MLYFPRVLLLILLVQSSQSRFIQATCRAGTRYCVQQNSQGTWCFLTETVHVVATDCPDSHLELQGAVDAHLKQDLSIAYYNGADNTRLGGVDYQMNAAGGIVRLCLSNKAGDGLLQTLCLNVGADNSVDGFPYCLVTLGPPISSDGCYTPDAATSSAISSTIISTSPSSSLHPTSTANPNPISISSSFSSSTTQKTTQPTSGIPSDSTKPKSNKLTTVVVPVVLTILLLVAIFGGIMFWRRQKRLERELRELRSEYPPTWIDSGGKRDD